MAIALPINNKIRLVLVAWAVKKNIGIFIYMRIPATSTMLRMTRTSLQHARTPTNNFSYCLLFRGAFAFTNKKCAHSTDLHISRNLFNMFARITICDVIVHFVG